MRINSQQWQQLSELLDTALDLTAVAREVWLENLPPAQATLKTSLLELLAERARVETDDLLDKPPDFTAALLADSARTQWTVDALQVSHIIGGYRLIRELGRGGMGAVWLAERVDGKFKRQVALKFPYAGPNQRQLAERLARERDILASLEHPNIARLYDADVADSGQPFLVLEYVDGIPINDYCDQHKLTLRERLQLFLQVLDAVRYAHAHLVIHRDLKPSNILITNDRMAHLLDFGIAKLVPEGESHETVLTQIGGQAMTPDYASPEQILGQPITTAADVYSLGVLLYELLTGNRPYRLPRLTRATLEEAITTADVVPPSRAAVDEKIAASRSINAQHFAKVLRGDLDTLVLKALKKNVADRYASTDAFLQDVKCYLDNQPIQAQPDTQWYRIRKFASRNRLAVASTAAIAVTLIIGSGVALWQAHEAALQRDRAVASAARSEAVTDFLRLMITEVADGNEPITMQQLIERSEAIAARTYVGDVYQQAAILEVLGNYYVSFYRMDKANDAFNKAIALAAKNADPTLQARLQCASALVNFQLGNVDLASRKVAAGLVMSGTALEVQAQCLLVRSEIKWQTDDLDGYLKDIQDAQQLLLHSGVNKPELLVELLSSEAYVYSAQGHTADADRQYTRAITLLNKLGRGETTTARQIEIAWGYAHSNNGDPLGALKHFDKANEIARKRIITIHDNGEIEISRAMALNQLARYEEALTEYREAIVNAEKVRMEMIVLNAREGMARTLLVLGRVEEAEQNMKIVKNATEKNSTDDGLFKQHAIFYDGMLAMRQEKFSEAIRDFSEIIDLLSAHHDERSGTVSYMLRWRGTAFLAGKDLSSALADAKRAWEIAHAVQGDLAGSTFSGDAALLLAKIYRAQQQNEQAHQWALVAYQQLQAAVGTDHPHTLEAQSLIGATAAHNQIAH